jgi:DNA-binding response OmpR family regulator
MPPLILLVDADKAELRQTEALLSEHGYLVAIADSYQHAKRLLDSVSPDLLIASIRLNVFNGLHLASRSRIDHPTLPVILTNAVPDSFLAKEAARQGATLIHKPLENPMFLQGVKAALEQYRPTQPAIRRWHRKRVTGVVEARIASSPARILDISLGGLRLAFDDRRDVPVDFDVEVPKAGITLKAHRVWTARSSKKDELWCGVELVEPGPPARDDWREFIESVT